MRKTVKTMILAGTAAILAAAPVMAEDFSDAPITVVSREEGSGTRGAFIELFGVESKNDAGEKVDNTTVEASVTNNTSVMMSTVAGNAADRRSCSQYCQMGAVLRNGRAPGDPGIEKVI